MSAAAKPDQSHSLSILMTRKKNHSSKALEQLQTTNLPMFFKLFNIFHGIPTTN